MRTIGWVVVIGIGLLAFTGNLVAGLVFGLPGKVTTPILAITAVWVLAGVWGLSISTQGEKQQ